MSESRDNNPADKKSSYEAVAAPAVNGMSRRRLFRALVGSAAALGAGFTLVQPEPANAQSKTPKKVAKYQDHPNKGNECSECRFFKPPHSCQLVAGKISPHGWCQFFAKKAA